MTEVVRTQESGAYWFFLHLRSALRVFIIQHKVASIILTLSIIILGLLFREEWQPWVVLLRRAYAPIGVSIGIIVLSVMFSRNARWYGRLAAFVGAGAVIACSVLAYEYLSLYMRFQSFHVEMIDKIPETSHERIQPLASVHALAQGVTGDSRDPLSPDYVWVKDGSGKKEFHWTMSVEPKLWIDKIFGTVEEVINVSGTDPAPRFTPESREKTRFAVGEGLWLSSNAHTAAIRKFGLRMFWEYEPTDVRFLQNDAREMVEVISLLRWRGMLFPYPEFGGVIVVKQQPETSIGNTVVSYLSRVLFGAGEWIPPEQVREHPYLQGQNILPYRVSQYVAESLRFMNGFFAPFPGYHQGDVRIPVSKGNVNQQPYTTYFEEINGLPGMLHHYFSLEPYLEGKHGLVASVLIPSDGSPRVFVYPHEQRRETLMGVSMVPGLVRDSKKNYNWERVAPVEERPFVRYIDGKRHFLWLTTVVTYEDVIEKDEKIGEKKREFSTSSVPEVVLVDPSSQEVFWVDPRDQGSWLTSLMHRK